MILKALYARLDQESSSYPCLCNLDRDNANGPSTGVESCQQHEWYQAKYYAALAGDSIDFGASLVGRKGEGARYV